MRIIITDDAGTTINSATVTSDDNLDNLDWLLIEEAAATALAEILEAATQKIQKTSESFYQRQQAAQK